MNILRSSHARRKVPHSTQKYCASRCASCDAPIPDPSRWICDRCKRLDLLTESRELREVSP